MNDLVESNQALIALDIELEDENLNLWLEQIRKESKQRFNRIKKERKIITSHINLLEQMEINETIQKRLDTFKAAMVESKEHLSTCKGLIKNLSYNDHDKFAYIRFFIRYFLSDFCTK